MKRNIFLKKTDGDFLSNKDKSYIDFNLRYYVVQGHVIDEGNCNYWSLDLDEWIGHPIDEFLYFQISEKTFDYITSRLSNLLINVQVGLIIPLSASLKKNNVPKELVLTIIDRRRPPIIDIYKGSIVDYLSYTKVDIVHPFNRKMNTYYWEKEEEDYYDNETSEYIHTKSYSRYVLLTI